MIREAEIILWDEISMTNKLAIHAVERSFRDILQNDQTFGGKKIIFGGDFRQILLVISHGSRAEIVGSTLKKSFL